MQILLKVGGSGQSLLGAQGLAGNKQQQIPLAVFIGQQRAFALPVVPGQLFGMQDIQPPVQLVRLGGSFTLGLQPQHQIGGVNGKNRGQPFQRLLNLGRVAHAAVQNAAEQQQKHIGSHSRKGLAQARRFAGQGGGIGCRGADQNIQRMLDGAVNAVQAVKGKQRRAQQDQSTAGQKQAQGVLQGGQKADGVFYGEIVQPRGGRAIQRVVAAFGIGRAVKRTESGLVDRIGQGGIVGVAAGGGKQRGHILRININALRLVKGAAVKRAGIQLQEQKAQRLILRIAQLIVQLPLLHKKPALAAGKQRLQRGGTVGQKQDLLVRAKHAACLRQIQPRRCDKRRILGQIG